MWISWRLHFVVISSVLFGFVFNTTSFLIKHKTSSSFLSISPKDEFFFLYPYSCRTFNHIFWTSGNGQILSSNGKVSMDFIVELLWHAAALEAPSHIQDTFVEEAHDNARGDGLADRTYARHRCRMFI